MINSTVNWTCFVRIFRPQIKNNKTIPRVELIKCMLVFRSCGRWLDPLQPSWSQVYSPHSVHKDQQLILVQNQYKQTCSRAFPGPQDPERFTDSQQITCEVHTRWQANYFRQKCSKWGVTRSQWHSTVLKMSFGQFGNDQKILNTHLYRCSNSILRTVPFRDANVYKHHLQGC